MASENLSERPQAGPDTMTKIMMLPIRNSEPTSERLVKPLNITEAKFNWKGLQMQEANTIKSIYTPIWKGHKSAWYSPVSQARILPQRLALTISGGDWPRTRPTRTPEWLRQPSGVSDSARRSGFLCPSLPLLRPGRRKLRPRRLHLPL